MRPVGCRLQAVDRDRALHAIPVQERPESVALLFKAAEKFREFGRHLGLEEEAEPPVAVVICRMHFGDAADRPRAIPADLDWHHGLPIFVASVCRKPVARFQPHLLRRRRRRPVSPPRSGPCRCGSCRLPAATVNPAASVPMTSPGRAAGTASIAPRLEEADLFALIERVGPRLGIAAPDEVVDLFRRSVPSRSRRPCRCRAAHRWRGFRPGRDGAPAPP